MEIIVVSGLPRSGTSLMMSMLAAGGVELLTDGVRRPDADNPRGYFELERVKSLATESAWICEARGKAVKVISPLLERLPPGERYRVVFMRRDLDEVLESQARMLARRGVAPPGPDPGLRAEFAAHLERVERWLRESPAFEVHVVSFPALLETPAREIDALARFLGPPLDQVAMRGCVEPALSRGGGGSEIPELT